MSFQYSTLAPLAAETFHTEGEDLVWTRTWLSKEAKSETAVETASAPLVQATQVCTSEKPCFSALKSVAPAPKLPSCCMLTGNTTKPARLSAIVGCSCAADMATQACCAPQAVPESAVPQFQAGEAELGEFLSLEEPQPAAEPEPASDEDKDEPVPSQLAWDKASSRIRSPLLRLHSGGCPASAHATQPTGLVPAQLRLALAAALRAVDAQCSQANLT